MSTFLALYRGASIGEARLIAVTADPSLVQYLARQLLSDNDGNSPETADPVILSLGRGRRQALDLICREDGDDAA